MKITMQRILFSAILFLVLICQACSDFSDLNNIEREEQEIELAVPLINTEFSVSDFIGENGPDNVSIKIDAEGRVTLVYQGDVVRQNISAVFPAVPYCIDLMEGPYLECNQDAIKEFRPKPK